MHHHCNSVNVYVIDKRKNPWDYDIKQSLKNHTNKNIGKKLSTVDNKECWQFWGNHIQDCRWAEQQSKRNKYDIIQNILNQSVKIDNLKNKQVIYVEPSNAQQKVNTIKKLGQIFRDQHFPPNNKSLIDDQGYGSDQQTIQTWKKIKWGTISQSIQNPIIFYDMPQPNDINQGALGDCYFLAGLAALAQRPDRIYKIFIVNQINKQKHYSVRLIYKGKWRTIDLDQFIPINQQNSLAFSQTKDGGLWVVLLEKAWAKLHGCFRRIQGGFQDQAIHGLTGAPITIIDLQDKNINIQDQWQYLINATQKQYAMTIATKSKTGKNDKSFYKNLAYSHIYTIIKVVQIDYKQDIQRLVLLRNPWGSGVQFNGKWSDGHPIWKQVSQQQKQRIGYDPVKQDGLFWMAYEDVVKYFSRIAIAQIQDDASYVNYTIRDQNIQGAYFVVQVNQWDDYSLQVQKTPDRIIPKKKREQYTYPDIDFQMGELKGKQCQKFQDIDTQSDRILYTDFQLQPGKYIVYVRINFDKEIETDYEITLSCYSKSNCVIRAATKEEIQLFQPYLTTGQEQQQQQN